MIDLEIRRFGKALRAMREQLGLSQEGFADLVDLDRSYIGGIERGERNPTLRTILRISSALNVEPSELFR